MIKKKYLKILSVFLVLPGIMCGCVSANIKPGQNGEKPTVEIHIDTKQTENGASETKQTDEKQNEGKQTNGSPKRIREKPHDYAEQVMKALVERDADGLKSMFCDKVQKLHLLDEEIANAFSFIDGDLKSYGVPEHFNDSESSRGLSTTRYEIYPVILRRESTTGRVYRIEMAITMTYPEDDEYVGVQDIRIYDITKYDINGESFASYDSDDHNFVVIGDYLQEAENDTDIDRVPYEELENLQYDERLRYTPEEYFEGIADAFKNKDAEKLNYVDFLGIGEAVRAMDFIEGNVIAYDEESYCAPVRRFDLSNSEIHPEMYWDGWLKRVKTDAGKEYWIFFHIMLSRPDLDYYGMKYIKIFNFTDNTELEIGEYDIPTYLTYESPYTQSRANFAYSD